MSDIGIQPSLRSTQALGAALLHQFARERFLDAGLDEELIHEAESHEHVDNLETSLSQDDNNKADQEQDCNNSTSNGDSSLADVGSIRENLSWSDMSDASTMQNDTINLTHDQSREQFHSIADSPTNGNEDTVYHSINRGQTSIANNLDRLQSTPLAIRYGRELEKIAEEFEKSRERQFFRQEAEKVAIESITREEFTQRLEELSKGGITREQIVVIFLFSTDVALRAASFAQELVVRLLGWSFSYIVNTVCRLVYELGGWEKLLFYQLPSLLISCCTILGICMLAFHLNRSLRWANS